MEWFSALEGAVAKIVKLVAGVEDEEPVAAAGGKAKSWAEQLERTYATVGERGGCGEWCVPKRERCCCAPCLGVGRRWSLVAAGSAVGTSPCH